jgi:hypothetical protein
MSDKIFHLILIVVAGVILADLVAHVAGTTTIVDGFGTLFAIGTQPTNVNAIKTIKTPVANTGNRKA